jgi:fatty acid desaturase
LPPFGSAKTVRQLKLLASVSDARGAWLILYNWALLFILLAANHVLTVSSNGALMLLHFASSLLATVRFGALESCTHQAVHFTLFRHRRFNDRLDFLFALPIAESVRSYRATHRIHHERFGTPEDPVVRVYAESGVAQFPHRFWWVMLVRPLLGYHTISFLSERMAMANEFRGWAARFCLFLTALLLLSYWTGSWRDLLWLYVVPVFLILPVFLFWTEVFDHAGLDLQPVVKSSRDITARLIVFFLYPHGEGYHLTHHLYPGIPSYRLPLANKILSAQPSYREHAQHVTSVAELLACTRKSSSDQNCATPDLGSRSLDRRAEFPRFFRRLQRTDFGRVSRSGLGL